MLLNKSTWRGCHDDSWQGLIVDEAFAHPAKMARGLVRRIFDYLDLPKGSVVVDPFGGIGTTAIEGASRGLQVYCVELEEKFVGLARQNFELHRRLWEASGDPLPVMVQGDSRRLREVLAGVGADCVISSPPYAETAVAGNSVTGGSQVNRKRLDESLKRKQSGQKGINLSDGESLRYGATPGQLGGMPAGSVDAVVSSPPYAELPVNDNQRFSRTDRHENAMDGPTPYGSSPGQLAAIPSGSVADCIVSSPPYADQSNVGGDQWHGLSGNVPTETPSTRGKPGPKNRSGRDYGHTPGQLGGMPAGSVDAVVGSNVDALPHCDTMPRKGDQSCQTAKTAESKSADEADGVSHVRESMSVNLSREDQSHLDMDDKLPLQGAGSRCQTTGDQRMSTGLEEATVGVDSDGVHRENLPSNEMITNASNAVPLAASKSTTKKKQSKQKASGTTACQTSKPFVPSVILQDTETNSALQFVQSAEQCTPPEHEASAVPRNAERSQRVGRKSDSTGSKQKHTHAPSAESSSGLLEADGNTAPSCASEQQDSESTRNQCDSDEPITFWEASRDIVRECHAILKPGGLAVFVCKDFVRKGQRVPFSDDWRRLCESVGFELVEWIEASLVKEDVHPSLFDDGPVVKRVERKSFFRRLAEQKGSPPIDHEDVLVFRKGLT